MTPFGLGWGHIGTCEIYQDLDMKFLNCLQGGVIELRIKILL